MKNIIDVECRVLVKNTKSKKADDDGNFRVYSNVDRILTAEDGPKKEKKAAAKKTTKKEKPEKKATKKTKTAKKEPEEDGGEDMFGDIF